MRTCLCKRTQFFDNPQVKRRRLNTTMPYPKEYCQRENTPYQNYQTQVCYFVNMFILEIDYCKLILSYNIMKQVCMGMYYREIINYAQLLMIFYNIIPCSCFHFQLDCSSSEPS